MRTALVFFAAATLCAAQNYATWDQYLGGAEWSQYSSLKQIDTSNITKLKVAWTLPTGPGSARFNPIVIDNLMYVVSGGAVMARDAVSGKEIWRHANQGAVGNRVMNYWESQNRSDRRLLYFNAGFLMEIDARSSASIPMFGETAASTSGRLCIATLQMCALCNRTILGVTAPKLLTVRHNGRSVGVVAQVTAGGLIFMGTSSDRKLRAYDQATGKVIWTQALGAATEGVPGTYQANGKQYLVVCAGAGSGTLPPQVVRQPDPEPGQYIV